MVRSWLRVALMSGVAALLLVVVGYAFSRASAPSEFTSDTAEKAIERIFQAASTHDDVVARKPFLDSYSDETIGAKLEEIRKFIGDAGGVDALTFVAGEQMGGEIPVTVHAAGSDRKMEFSVYSGYSRVVVGFFDIDSYEGSS